MRTRTIIILIILIAVLLGAVYLNGAYRHAGNTAGPTRTVSAFYDNWLEYSQEPPTRQSLLDRLYTANPYVTEEFIEKVDAVLLDFDETGYDPITCAPTRPDTVDIDQYAVNGNTAVVIVREMFGESSQSVNVHLINNNGTWWLADIDCTPDTQTVFLFYYREDIDHERNGGKIACDPEAVVPVERKISSDNIIIDTITLLIAGVLSPDELDQGYSTEFPNADFHLESMQLARSNLTLTFSEVPGFTTGGACRVQLLHAQIEKTAMQFPEVRRVYLKPDGLFQP